MSDEFWELCGNIYWWTEKDFLLISFWFYNIAAAIYIARKKKLTVIQVLTVILEKKKLTVILVLILPLHYLFFFF
jgi:hypothetical protein